MATLTRPLSYEEWLRVPPVGEGREEVVNGEIVVMPPNRYTHAEVVRRLTEALAERLKPQGAKVFGSSISLLISREPLICRAPDILVYARDGVKTDKHDVLCSAPDLIIEVISPSETKRRKDAKLDDYARIGVPEAWLISPEGETVEIRLLKNGKLVTEKVVADGTIEPTRFPGVAISIPEIWPENLD